MEDLGYPDNTSTDEPLESQKFPFCMSCNRISCSEPTECIWCGSPELEQFTMRDISAHFREMIYGSMSSQPASVR